MKTLVKTKYLLDATGAQPVEKGWFVFEDGRITVVGRPGEPNSFDNWYYQGVACCLVGEYRRAARAMERCLAVTEQGDASLLCPVVHWLWLLYMRLGDKAAAARVLEKVDEQTPVLAMAPSYKKAVLLYKGVLEPAGFIDESQLTSTDERALLYYITESYCLANFYYLNGSIDQSNEILRKLKEISQYHYVFAYMLAEQDMRQRGI